MLMLGRAPDSSRSVQRARADDCEYGNKLLDSIKGGEFLYKLSDYQLSDKDSID